MEKDQIRQILEYLYLWPSKPSSLGGIDRLFKEARARIPGLKRQDVVDFLHTQFAYTQHKPTRKKFRRRKVIAVNINDVYHVDLIDMQKVADFNEGFKYLLTVIDCFSRYCMAVPIKNKTPQSTIEGLTKVFKEYGIPLKLFSDNGTEFLARPVKAFLKELNIQQWNSKNPGKAVQVERFNRTLKERLWVYMTDKNNLRYIDVLDDVLRGYNDSVHSSTGFAPSKVGSDEVMQILEHQDAQQAHIKLPSFEPGDHVRVAKEKLTFEKGYETKYSQMIYKIQAIRRTDSHYIYRIVDLAGLVEPGWFYENELSKVVIDKYEKHRIARIVRERKLNGRLQYLVNWAGYPSNYDSWEFADEVT